MLGPRCKDVFLPQTVSILHWEGKLAGIVRVRQQQLLKIWQLPPRPLLGGTANCSDQDKASQLGAMLFIRPLLWDLLC